MRPFLSRLADRRLTVSLFVGFLGLFCLGLILPQRPQLLPGELEAFADRWPTLARLASATGLDDVYRSEAMLVLFGACVLQLLAWLFLRIGPVLRDAFHARAEPPEGMPIRIRTAGDRRSLEAMVKGLRSRRFAVREIEAGTWFAEKNRLSGISSLAFHASFVILLGGAWLLKASLFRGSVILAEGQPFAGTLGEYQSVTPAGSRPEDLPEVAFTPRRLSPVFTPKGRTQDMVCEASVGSRGGEQSESRTFAVNRPLRIGDANVLVNGFGLAPVFTVHGVRTGREVDAVCVNLGVWAPGLPEDSFRLLEPRATVHARFYPDHEEGPDGHRSRGMELLDPAMHVRVAMDPEEHPQAEGLLRVGESLEVGGYRLTLAELRTWGSFHVSRQKGWLLITGFLVMVVSIAVRFFFVRRSVSLQLQRSEHGEELWIGGRTAFFPEQFRYHLETMLAKALRDRPALPPETEESP